MNKPTKQLQSYWTAATQAPRRRKLPISGQHQAGEFPQDANTLVIEGGASRRKFMGILGASSALAGLTNTGCIRKPLEKILPFSVRPEDMAPGVSMYYATGYELGGTVQGLLVESIDGRPIKIEGNPRHPGSRGKTDGFAQASILNLYDPDRSQNPKSKVVAAVDTGSGSTEERKARAIERLATEAYERALKETRSIDAARNAKAQALELGQKASAREIKTASGTAVEVRVPSKTPVKMSWDSAWALFDEVAGRVASARGAKAALLLPQTSSPTFRHLVAEITKQLPQLRVFVEDAQPGNEAEKTLRVFGGDQAGAHYSLSGAEVIFAADSDFLSTEPDHTRLTTEWAQLRKATTPDTPMSRLYAAESRLSVTGGAADHRQAVASSEIPLVLSALVRELVDTHKRPIPTGAQELVAGVKAPEISKDLKTFVVAMAKDMVARPDKSVVLVGQRQPAGAHTMGLLINALLGSLGDSQGGLQRLRDDAPWINAPGMAELAQLAKSGDIETLVCLGTNPAYTAPASLEMDKSLGNVRHLVHTGLYLDETAKLAGLHIPCSHYLEAWGDLECSEGTRNICQPLIAPLYDTPSKLELLARFLRPGKAAGGYDLVKGFWALELGSAQKRDRLWNKWLNQGVVSGVTRVSQAPANKNWSALTGALRELPAPRSGDAIEVNFHVDSNLYLGEFANNAWMQECPRAVSKLVWDNAVLLGKALADKLGVKNGEMLTLKLGDRSLSMPAWLSYGQAENTVSVSMGTGRDIGNVSQGAGFDVNKLRSHQHPAFESGQVSRGSGRYELVTTQDYGLLDPDGEDGIGFLNYPERPIYRETDVAGFKKDPEFAAKDDLIHDKDRLEPLWERPKLDGLNQWGMSIDLNRCVGCNACQIACQSENNIPVVGKKEVSNGREMHWLRMDRYYKGDLNSPEMVFMPVACMHCETAPCENVCPVQATAHSPEGLNDMAYNRCVGTRYCANNCPYKVRRFNFFNYNKDLPEVVQLSKNPDVTIRFRGVIEKCSYCVQRITAAKIRTHVKDESLVKDGEVLTACQQVCAAEAISFGNLKDKDAQVVKDKASPRTYGLLSDLGTLPRTTYLARVRNPNPELS